MTCGEGGIHFGPLHPLIANRGTDVSINSSLSTRYAHDSYAIPPAPTRTLISLSCSSHLLAKGLVGVTRLTCVFRVRECETDQGQEIRRAFRRYHRDVESKSRRKPRAKKASTSEQKVRQIRRKSRKQYSGEEKIRIVLDGLRGEESVSELCRSALKRHLCIRSW